MGRKLLLLFLLFPLFWAEAAFADASAPFLWQVRGAHATHFLLGSVHLLPKAAAQLPDGIADAYGAAEGLVFESDIGALSNPKSALSLLAAAKAPKGLKAEVDAATYSQLQNRMAVLRMPASLCEQYKPWFCALTLEVFAYQRAGFTGEYGLDRQLYNAATTDGKALAWFESPEIHLSLFTTMPEALSKQFLNAELSETGPIADEARKIYRAWRENDASKIETLIAEMKANFPMLYARLLVDRNRAWAGKLKRYLDGADPQLIVVGAAHWLGPEGLLAQLKAAGYSVKPYVVADKERITELPPRPELIAVAALSGLPQSR